MDDFEEETQAAPPRTQKRSFFSKPSASFGGPATPSSSTIGHDDDTDFFRQSGTVFNSILAEQERKKKERLVKKLKQREKERDEDDEEPAESSNHQSHKKRRIWDGGDSNGQADPARLRSPVSQPADLPETSTKTRQSPRKQPAPVVVDLGDSDTEEEPQRKDEDDDLYAPPAPRRTPTKPKLTQSEVIDVGDGPDADEDDYSDLLARARERKRQKELDALKATLGQQANGTTGEGSKLSGRGVKKVDPPVSILITTTIEGTKPLIVKIYLSRKVGELRKKWCEYNGLGGSDADDVVFAWRRLRQWDTTSLRRMLEGVVDFEVRDDGSIASAAGGRGDGLSEDLSRIHLVATTAAGLDELRREHSRNLHAPTAEDIDEAEDPAGPEDDGGGGAQEAGQADAEKEVFIPIVLKEQKEYGELKLKVKPDTTFERIAAAFRTSKKVPEGKTVVLIYDGDRLDAAAAMKDSEIEARDIIEVYIR